MKPADKSCMQNLYGLRDGRRNKAAHAQDLLIMIENGSGSWELGWCFVNKETQKKLYCPICFKCVNRVKDSSKKYVLQDLRSQRFETTCLKNVCEGWI